MFDQLTMSNPTYILVRITPSQPVSPDAFRAALQGVTITAFDKSVSSPTKDRTLGSASGLVALPDLGHLPVVSIPPLVVLTCPSRFEAGILQHIKPVAFTGYSVATAIIIVDPAQIGNTLEYPTPTSFDVRLELTQSGSGSPSAVIAQEIVDFNITTTTKALSLDQNTYMVADADIYLSIDVPKEPLPDGVAIIAPNPKGQPPSFDTVREAINKVLAKDQTIGAPSLECMAAFLSTAQAQQIASELTYNTSLDPPPAPPYATADFDGVIKQGTNVFEDLYTDNGTGIAVTLDNARQKFESARTSYYALQDASATQLANYVFGAIMAVQVEQYTIQKATQAILDIPIKPTITHTSSNSSSAITLSGSATPPATTVNALSPAFVVPAPFIYALTTSSVLTQDFQTRIQVLLTSSADSLSGLMRQAIDAQVLHAPDADGFVCEKTTLTSSCGVTINQYQAIRRLVALKPSLQPASDALVQPANNAEIHHLVTDWLAYKGTDDDMLAGFWTPRFCSKEYLSAILEVIAPNQENLISDVPHVLMTPSCTAVTTVDDLVQITEASWLAFFQAKPGDLPQKYLLGDLSTRVHSFVQDISKVLYLASATAPPVTYSATSVPYLNGVSDNNIIVKFFGSFTTFSFSDPFGAAQRKAVYEAALALFGGEVQVAAFVANAAEELWTLYQLTNLGGRKDPR
jgi:hypothetical protein